MKKKYNIFICFLMLYITVSCFAYADDFTPVITRISPDHGRPGDVVTISGYCFGTQQGMPPWTRIYFGGTEVNYITWTGMAMTVSVPDLHHGQYPVTVKSNLGGTSAPYTFTIDPPPGPYIDKITPAVARPETVVVITGSRFTETAGSVKFGTTAGENVTWSDTSISVKVPKIAGGDYKVTVINDNGTSNEKPFVVDTTGPANCSIKICGDDPETNVTSVLIVVNASDAQSGMGDGAQMKFSNDGTTYCDPEPFVTGARQWILSSGYGTKTVYALFKDAAGNWSDVCSDTINYCADTKAPYGQIKINGGAEATNLWAVTLSMEVHDNQNGSGMGQGAEMKFSNDNVTWTTPEAYNTTKPWDLTSGYGRKTVYAAFKDVAGNWSNAFSATILVSNDTTPPTNCSIVINANAEYTNFRIVTLTLSATDSNAGMGQGAKMIFSNDNVTWSYPEDYASSTTWAALTEGDGVKTVYAKFKDAAGNWTTQAVSDTIKLDTVAPGTQIAINNGAAATCSAAVNINFATQAPQADTIALQFSNDNTTWSTDKPYVWGQIWSFAWTLASGDGTKTVYAKFKDKAGNLSSAYSDTIQLDTTPPSGYVLINEGADTATSASVKLRISASDIYGSGMGAGAQMKLTNDNNNWPQDGIAYNTSKDWTLTSGYGEKTVYIMFKDIAGNWSTAYSDKITVRPPAPTGLAAVVKSAAQVDLTWTDNASDETGYKIDRQTDSGDWVLLTANALPANAAAYSDQSITTGALYSYRVYACSANGVNSDYSNIATADANIFNPPTNLVASRPSGYGKRINLSWTDNSNCETGFEIERCLTQTGTFSRVGTVAANVATYADDALQCATMYYYKVRAVKGTASTTYTNTASAETGPAAPTGLSANAILTAPGRVDLSWIDNAANETGYRIDRKKDTGSWTVLTTTALVANTKTYSDTTAATGSVYIYRVYAFSANGGYSDYSSEVTADLIICNPPTNLVASRASGYGKRINLTWTDNSNCETGFEIERSLTSSGTFSRLGSVAANVTSYSDDAPACATAYYYRVRAVKGTTNTVYTNTASAETGPAAPTSVIAVVTSQTRVDLAWTDNASNEAGYRIDRKKDSGTWTVLTTTALAANTKAYSDTTVTSGSVYSYRVYAFSTNGGNSDYSDIVTCETKPLTAPSGVIGSPAGSTKLYITWTDNSTNETGFEVEKSLSQSGPFTLLGTAAANVTSYMANSLQSETVYYLRVRAVNGWSSSAYSSVISAQTGAPAPTGLSAVIKSTTRVDLTWTDNASKEFGYYIWRKKDSGDYIWIPTTFPANTISYTDTNVSSGSVYIYFVCAVSDSLAHISDKSNFCTVDMTIGQQVQGTIVINDGAKFSISKYVYPKLTATSTAAAMTDNGKMCFSENGTTWSAWENYAVSREYELPKGNGTKTVYVKYKDKLGNESAGNISASIQLAEPSKMAGVSYLEGATLTQGIVMNFGQKKDKEGQNLGIRLYNKSTGVPQRIHSMVGSPVPDCKSVTRARITSSSYDDLVVDFGPAYGIWVCSNCKTWSGMLHSLTAKSITAADINNDNKDELIIDFGAAIANPYKVWVYTPSNGTWSALHTVSPRSISAGNVDGVQGSDLVLDFGIYGLWIYYNNATWGSLHTGTADQIVLGDINADGRDEIVIDFGELYGIWVNYPKETDNLKKWKCIDGQSPNMMVIGNIDVDTAGKKDIILDYGDNAGTTKKSGIAIWANDTGLTQLHSLSSEGMVFSGNDLVVNFGAGNGEWIYRGSSTQTFKWVQMDTVNAE